MANEMTPAMVEQAKAWIAAKGGACQCGSTYLNVDRQLFVTSSFDYQTDEIELGRGLIVVAGTCTDCARTTFFNGVQMGLTL